MPNSAIISSSQKEVEDGLKDRRKEGKIRKYKKNLRYVIIELAKAVREAAKEIYWERLNEYAERFPNGAVKKTPRLSF